MNQTNLTDATNVELISPYGGKLINLVVEGGGALGAYQLRQ